jgi:hypothetical protein
MNTVFKMTLAFIFTALLAACGGGGGSMAIENDEKITILNTATFSNQVPGGVSTMQSMQAMMMGGGGVTSNSISASIKPIGEFLLSLFGIKSALANGGSSNNMLYSLDSEGGVSSLNLIEYIEGESGDRKTVPLDLLLSADNNSTPRLMGMLNTPKFILLSYQNLYKPSQNGAIDKSIVENKCHILVLQKSDGKIFCLDLQPWCEDFSNCGNAHGNTSIQASASGDIIYMQDVHTDLYKINLVDPSNIIKVKLTDRMEDGPIQSLIVNAVGDAYVDIDTGVPFQNFHRIYKADGLSRMDYQSLPDQFLNCTFTGSRLHNDGNNFYFRDEGNVLKKYTKNNDGSFIRSDIYSNPNWNDNPLNASSGRNCIKSIGIGNYVFQLPTYNKNDNSEPNFVTEVLNPDLLYQSGSRSPRKITISGVDTIFDIVQCSNGFFVFAKNASGKDTIVKYSLSNPGEDTMSLGEQRIALAASSNYSVLQFSVGANCSVEIIGVSQISGNKVIASLSLDPDKPVIIKTLAAGDSISKIVPIR